MTNTSLYTPGTEIPVDLTAENLEDAIRNGSCRVLMLHSLHRSTMLDQWGQDTEVTVIEDYAVVYRTGMTVARNDGYEDREDQIMRCVIDPDLWFVESQNYIDCHGGRNWSAYDLTPEDMRPTGSLYWQEPKKSERYAINEDGEMIPVNAEAFIKSVTNTAATLLQGCDR